METYQGINGDLLIFFHKKVMVEKIIKISMLSVEGNAGSAMCQCLRQATVKKII